jgi:multimeric flavodoxin WrbA
MKGAVDAKHTVDRVFLGEKTIHYCTGCGVCNNTGKCVQKDDMADILALMVEADVIVMATPVYFFTMCAQMKTLIDRTVTRYTEISNKDFYFLVTAAVNSKAAMQRTVEGFRGFTSCLSGAKEKGIVYGTSAWEIGDILSSGAMKQAFEMGKSL